MASLNRTKLIVDIVAFVIGFLHIVGIIILFAMPVQNNGESTSNTNGTVFMVILNLLFGLLYFAFFVVDIVLIVQLFITLGKVSDASKSEYDKSSTLLIFMILSIFITLIFTIILFFKLKEIVEKTSVISDVNNSDNVETKIIETQENPKNTLL
ncbi:MAG: hypothetical protein KFW07_03865 [Mycoplasmataceae bacterium]|nr:hypothetical protein [Mycoplasmataceae bacterium]